MKVLTQAHGVISTRGTFATRLPAMTRRKPVEAVEQAYVNLQRDLCSGLTLRKQLQGDKTRLSKCQNTKERSGFWLSTFLHSAHRLEPFQALLILLLLAFFSYCPSFLNSILLIICYIGRYVILITFCLLGGHPPIYRTSPVYYQDLQF